MKKPHKYDMTVSRRVQYLFRSKKIKYLRNDILIYTIKKAYILV